GTSDSVTLTSASNIFGTATVAGDAVTMHANGGSIEQSGLGGQFLATSPDLTVTATGSSLVTDAQLGGISLNATVGTTPGDTLNVSASSTLTVASLITGNTINLTTTAGDILVNNGITSSDSTPGTNDSVTLTS